MRHVIIVGAGPAGASLAGLLAHQGIRVTLLERRRDFAREFRGEVLMPSGIEALQQMGIGAILEAIPTQPQRLLSLYMNGQLLFNEMLPEDIFNGRLPLAVSQPALLEALVSHAGERSHFSFERGTAVKELIRQGSRITGVHIKNDDGERHIAADLVIGADGRNSVVRRQAGLEVTQNSPPMDIVWCKVPCPENWQGASAYAGRGHLLFAYRTWDDSLQLGWVILKGTFGELRARGIEQWIEIMAHHVDPELGRHLRASTDAIHKPFLLDTVSNCANHWSVPGALVIGDAAHTMSPVGGQGVNIALRDAVVTANHLVPVLTARDLAETTLNNALAAIEAERMPEVREIQTMQAQPPKIMLSRSWWGEPVRRLVAAALKNERLRHRAAAQLAAFPFGVNEVRLTLR